MLRLNVPMAMKLALDGLKDAKYKTRETDIEDVGGYETVELSVMLCNDDFICKLNKEWRGEDHATDVLSMSQHVPELKLPVVRFVLVFFFIYWFLKVWFQMAKLSTVDFREAYDGRYRHFC